MLQTILPFLPETSSFRFLLLLFTCQVISNSLQHHGLQHTRLSYPSPYPRVCPSSCPLNWWCHPTISSSVTLFFCLQSFPASGSFPMSWLFASGTYLLQALAGYFLRKVILSSRNVAQIIYLRVSKMEVNHDFWCWESVKTGDPKIKKNPLPLCIPRRWQVFSGSNCVLRKQSPEMRSGSPWVLRAPGTARRAEDQTRPDNQDSGPRMNSVGRQQKSQKWELGGLLSS